MVGDDTLGPQGAPGGLPGVDWPKLKRAMSRDAFVRAYPVPFLLRRAQRPFPTPGGDEPPTAPSHLGFETKVMEPGKTAPPPTRLPTTLVLPIMKVGGHANDKISLGRAINCDLVVRDESVSKLHAYFRVTGPNTAEVTDARSSNRTLVNAKIIETGLTARVVSGDTLIFGRVALQFLDAGAIYDQL